VREKRLNKAKSKVEIKMKDWKFVALWAFILVSGLLDLLLGMTMGIPIVEAVYSYNTAESFGNSG
jgi:hypothetical protein